MRLGRPHAARGVGRAAVAVTDAPGDDLGAPGPVGWRAMAVLGRGSPGYPISACPAVVGEPGRTAAGGAVQRGGRRAAGGRADGAVPDAADDRQAAGFV